MSPRPAFTAKQRLKCFEDHGAIVLCQCGDPNCDTAIWIKDAQIDHHLALIDGGKHEQLNFRPMALACHKKKSRIEHIENCRAKRRNAKHFGDDSKKPKRKGRAWPPARPLRGRSTFPKCPKPMQSRPFPKRIKLDAAE